MNSAPTGVRYLNIAVSEKGLSEFSEDRRIIFIAREEIQSIQLRQGSGAERPILQLIVSLPLVALGIVGLSIVGHGPRGFYWGTGFIVFGGLGAWFLYETLKKHHYLWVTCRQDKRKLIFRGRFQEGEFSRFSTDALKLGYHFDEMTKPI